MNMHAVDTEATEFHDTTFNDEFRKLQASPAASDWLKQTVRGLNDRDPLDAYLDAAYLLRLMKLRCDEALADMDIEQRR